MEGLLGYMVNGSLSLCEPVMRLIPTGKKSNFIPKKGILSFRSPPGKGKVPWKWEGKGHVIKVM